MSIASRVLPCSVRITALRKRACGSRGLAASALFTLARASRCCPALRNLLASWSSSARVAAATKKAHAQSVTTPRLRIVYGAVIVCIVLYFQGPTKGLHSRPTPAAPQPSGHAQDPQFPRPREAAICSATPRRSAHVRLRDDRLRLPAPGACAHAGGLRRRRPLPARERLARHLRAKHHGHR